MTKFYPKRLVILFGCASLVILGLFVLHWDWGNNDVTDFRTCLSSSISGMKVSPARWVGFGYTTEEISRRLNRKACAYTISAARKALSAKGSSPDVDSLLAALAILSGDVRRAQRLLGEATRSSPDRADLWSDLSAVYLEEADIKNEPIFIFLALAASEKALLKNDDLLEARFNRAIALEKLCLYKEALHAWKQYLKVDEDSLWANEGRRHFINLALREQEKSWENKAQTVMAAALVGDRLRIRAIISQFPQQSREWTEDELLCKWATLQLRDSPQSSIYLAVARITAATIQEETGDAMLSNEVHVIDQLRMNGKLATLRDLALGHLSYSRALKASAELDTRGVRLYSSEAAKHFLLADSPFSNWAMFLSALAGYQENRYQFSVDVLKLLSARIQKYEYPILRGRIAWLQGLIMGIQGQTVASNSLYEEAVSYFNKSRQFGYKGVVQSLLAENFMLLGDRSRAWRSGLDASSDAQSIKDPKLYLGIYERLALLCLISEEAQIATYFEDQGIRAVRKGSPSLLAGSLARRAEMAVRSGQNKEGLVIIQEAEKLSVTIKSPEVREDVDADIHRIMGELSMNDSPAVAETYLSAAIESYTKANYRYYLARSYFMRGLAKIRVRRREEAKYDFHAGMLEVERERSQVFDKKLRVSYGDEVYNLLGQVALAQANWSRDGKESFETTERSRSRLFTDFLTKGEGDEDLQMGRVTSLSELQNSLPPDALMIEFSSLQDRLLIWVIDRRKVRFIQKLLPFEYLSAAVERLLVDVELAKAQDFASASEIVSKMLLGSLGGYIKGHRLIVFSPDRFLYKVPFAALFSPEGSNYIVENYDVVVAPSATLYLKSMKEALALDNHKNNNMLIMADPSFDLRRYPELPNLKGTRREAAMISSVFNRAEIVFGDKATKRKLFTAGAYGFVHLAVHALPNDDNFLFSKFILSPSPGVHGSGELFAYEIYDHHFAETRLVALSACYTASTGESTNESVESLVHPFLAAGVPTVIGSLWKVDDNSAPRIFADFYAGINMGLSPAAALRKAQLLSVGRRDPISAWAGFLCIGAS